ncbi:tetratricopeptide repeat-containing sensor histidine kinase [Polaribacter sargassicola]|uniref:tetratricopeptide repeat-containing sensor histidine kinase n=1 Tax=Polaribacter sargassicola TaxID=2836891 RepID=UPI001F4838C5|nr:sensor histidine kinase [Polaribacter sp. DS7-9]MCG1036237.1 sensor histidine kinase [Polaribacter sp. DS7-9]
MKQIKKFFLLFFLSSYIFSINKSNLIIETNYTKNSEETRKLQLKQLDSLINKTKDIEYFSNLTERYLAIVLELKKYNTAASKVLTWCSFIEIEFNEPDLALLLLNKIEKHKNKITEAYLLANLFQKKARAYYNKDDYVKALKNCNTSINTYSNKKKDSLFKADAIFLKGQIFVKTNNFIEAIKNYELAARFYEKLNDIEYTFFIKTAIISIYSKIGLNRIAIDKLIKIINEKESTNYNTGLTSNYYNLAINYKEVGNIKKYKYYLFKALKNKRESKDNDGFIPYYQTAIAKYYIENETLDKAKKYLNKASFEINKKKNHLSIDFFNKIKSFFLFKNNQHSEALSLAKKTLLEIKNHGDLESKKELNKLIYSIYIKNNDFKNALHYYQSYSKIRDSITNLNKISLINYYQTLAKKEKEEQQKNERIRLLEKTNKSKKQFIIFIIIFFILLFIIIYLYWNRLIFIKKRKMQIDFSQKLLLAQEEQRKRISKDLHDGVGHSLLLIKNKIAPFNDDSAEELINDALEEMRNIARALYPFQLKGIGITSALENLMCKLDANSQIFIFGNLDNIDNTLNIDQEVNIFRIVQECLSNVIKHSKADSAKVSLHIIKKNIKIIIQDNGIGFNYVEKSNDKKSLGLKTIIERVKFLKGQLKIISDKNSGTTINILFPIK